MAAKESGATHPGSALKRAREGTAHAGGDSEALAHLSLAKAPSVCARRWNHDMERDATDGDNTTQMAQYPHQDANDYALRNTKQNGRLTLRKHAPTSSALAQTPQPEPA